MAGAGLGVEPRELGSVAVAVGPGGFTGLRVSIAFAKAVALARGISLVPVPSALLFAASDHARGGDRSDGPWLVALAAKGETAWTVLVEDLRRHEAEGRVLDAAGFAAMARVVAGSQGALLADEFLDPALAECARDAGLPQGDLRVEIAAFAEISAAILRARGTVAPAALLPIYAREPEAVTNWRTRNPGRGS